MQRRRGDRAAAAGGSAAQFNHQSWGWGGDILWFVMIFWMIWAMSAFWWR